MGFRRVMCARKEGVGWLLGATDRVFLAAAVFSSRGYEWTEAGAIFHNFGVEHKIMGVKHY